MSQDVTASEARRRAQEDSGDAGQEARVPAAPSEASGEEQEQRHQATPQVSEEELRRRQEQSEKDRLLHQMRLEAEKMAERIAERRLEDQRRQEQEARERQMVEEMDDEDYGRYMREKESREALRQEMQQEAMARGFQMIAASTISLLPAGQQRDELAKKVGSGEVGSWEEFFDTAAKLRLMPELQKLEREAREAARNEQFAEEAGFLAPQAGSGVPTTALDPKRMSSTQKMALGWAKGPTGKT